MDKTTTLSQRYAELSDAFALFWDGSRCLFRALLRIFDAGAHRFPYAYLFVLAVAVGVPSVMAVMSARAERDAASKRAYEAERKLDSMTAVTDGRAYVIN